MRSNNCLVLELLTSHGLAIGSTVLVVTCSITFPTTVLVYAKA